MRLEDGKPAGVIRTGVRIFPDGRNPKDGSSLAVTRREARQQRRMRDRKLKRQHRLMDALIAEGLMPQTKPLVKSWYTDPLEIRAVALDQAVDPHHLGRALFHISKRRGFKSNRKTDKGDGDSGVIATSVSATKEQMDADGARTYGEWLHKRRERGEGVRARTVGSGAKKTYEVYSDRAMTEQEIDQLFECQRKLGVTTCSEAARSTSKTSFCFRETCSLYHRAGALLKLMRTGAPWPICRCSLSDLSGTQQHPNRGLQLQPVCPLVGRT